jgi:hypothetical protein
VPLAGCGTPRSQKQLREPAAILREVDRVGRRAQNLHAGLLERQRQFERRLAAKLHDARHFAVRRALALDDRHHIFEGQRLEVEAIGGVVIG